jgi:hypothetical protein
MKLASFGTMIVWDSLGEFWNKQAGGLKKSADEGLCYNTGQQTECFKGNGYWADCT